MCCRCSGMSPPSDGSTGRRSRRCRKAPTSSARSGTPTVSTATAPTSSRATTSTRRNTTSTWTEMGIGCEACHGPGRQHVTLMEAWEKDPASKPKYDHSSKNRQLSDILKILSRQELGAAAHLRHLRLLPRQQDATCLSASRAAIATRITRCRSSSAIRFPTTICRANSGLTAAQPFQSSAGVDAERLLQGRRDRVHQLSRRSRIAQRLLAEGEHQPGPQRRRALHAVPYEAGQVSPGATSRSTPSMRRLRRLPMHQLPHERRELAVADPPPRSHVPAAGAREHRAVRHPERLHDLSRRSNARMGGEADDGVVGRRRSPRASRVARRHACIARALVTRRRCRDWRIWRSIDSQGLLIRASAADYIGRLVAESRTGHVAASPSMQSQTSFAGAVAPSTFDRHADRSSNRRNAAPGHPGDRQCPDWRGGRS